MQSPGSHPRGSDWAGPGKVWDCASNELPGGARAAQLWITRRTVPRDRAVTEWGQRHQAQVLWKHLGFLLSLQMSFVCVILPKFLNFFNFSYHNWKVRGRLPIRWLSNHASRRSISTTGGLRAKRGDGRRGSNELFSFQGSRPPLLQHFHLLPLSCILLSEVLLKKIV